AQPDDDRGGAGLHRAGREVFVLGQDDRLVGQGVRPDRAILRVPQADVLNMGGVVTRVAQPTRQRRRELGVDQQLHVARESTAWSTCLAAYSRLARMSSRSR